MRFDDRLATVLDQPAADARGRAVQWRQLVELVARGEGISPELLDRALVHIGQLIPDLPSDLLAATARAIAGKTVPAELVALFAARGASASVALIVAVDLTPAGWNIVRSAAAADVLPLLAALDATPSEAEPAGKNAHPVIAPVLPTSGLFRWETGPNGEIDWVEGAPRSALIGRTLAESFAAPFAARLPFSDECLTLGTDGALSGEWRWSGAPAFYPDTGRFAGYCGIARREHIFPDTATAPAPPNTALEEDHGLRELVHELRTPLNAIIGFGEIIEGQYLGPAHRAYRERATEIVRQARGLSDAVDNLDLAARLRTGRLHGEAHSALDLVRAVLENVRLELGREQVKVTIEDRGGTLRVALPPSLAERLVGQFAAAMLAPAGAGEQIGVVVDRFSGSLAIAIDRPRALRGLSEQQILADRDRAGMGFGLRLVQGLAEMTGGRLDIGADRLVLLLPLAN